uniref:Transcription elongation factor SPT5 (inferred by orthology to a C. elegans protein) n=1 Tax=Anisakis simplex TaxID=6269 RepID=A0A0M3K257_ANISI
LNDSRQPEGSGNEEDEDDDDAEDTTQVKKAKKRRLDSDEDDDEDEEDDGEEEEDEEDDEEDEDGDTGHRGKKSKKKKRRTGVHQFILDDVEVDDDEEEEVEYEDDGDEMGIDPREREEAERLMKEQDERNREVRRRDLFSGMNEDQIEDYFKMKYSTQPSYAGTTEDDAAMDDISRHSLLPCTKDPNLWILKCRMGDEKMVALQLMPLWFVRATSSERAQSPVSLFMWQHVETFKMVTYRSMQLRRGGLCPVEVLGC